MELAMAKLEGVEKIALDVPFDTTIESTGRMQFEILPYGVYFLCRAKGVCGKEFAELSGLLGKAAGEEFSGAINLSGKAFPLVLAGNTEIRGDVHVGPAGVIPGRFEGRGFDGSVLVHGNIITDGLFKMPHVDSLKAFGDFISHSQYRGSGDLNYDIYVDVVDDNFAELKDVKSPVFESGLRIRLEKGILNLTDKRWRVIGKLEIGGKSRLSGFGIIEVEGSCVIDDQAELRDLMLICSGEISVRGGSFIKCQLLSNTDIVITDSVRISWPGTAILYCEDQHGNIRYESAVESSGSLILLIGKESVRNQQDQAEIPRIIIEQQAGWLGIIYSEAYAAIKGRVIGNVSTREFYFYSQPTAYFNWLVDANLKSDSALVGSIIPTIFTGDGGYAFAYYY